LTKKLLPEEPKKNVNAADLANLLPSLHVEEVEAGQPGLGKETVMGTTITAVQALCPLCGSPVLSVGRSGRVFAEDLRPIQLGPEIGRGYTLCDDCGLLAHLPTDLTLN
jgi:hypothetical protein